MKKAILASLALGIGALSQGCANFTSPARNHEIDTTKSYWIDYDASRRGAIVVATDRNIKTCSEPSPDVALTLVSKLEGEIENGDAAKADAKAEFNATVVQLAKRTQMVMFLREALYRLCEQSLNNNFSEDQILSTYEKILDTAIKIVETDQKEANARATEAEVKLQQILR